MMKKVLFAGCVSGAILAASSASAMTASFRWCSGSPEFQVGNVPKGTAKLDLRMLDVSIGYPHGGGTVAYSGQKTIACGAMNATFTGPSPPAGTVHTYEWTIRALDASGNVLDQTKVSRPFPQK